MTTHFCEIPTEAVCGTYLYLDAKVSPNFYKHTTSTFSNITCKGCREVVYETRLKSFGRPPEWNGMKLVGAYDKNNLYIQGGIFCRVVKKGKYE